MEKDIGKPLGCDGAAYVVRRWDCRKRQEHDNYSMTPARDTIFALSSGRPPVAIAVVRISGPNAGTALEQLSGRLPQPRYASLARLRDPVSGENLDEALALWFPAPRSETGEDMAELQLHGGRAVIAAVLAALGRLTGFRPAEAGEFTRRAVLNGRMDLLQAEAVADLIDARTTAMQRPLFPPHFHRTTPR